MTKPEIRAANAEAEIRSEGEGVKVAGYPAIFNSRTSIGNYFTEEIAPGAFDGVLGDDVRFLINHEGLPLARVSSGTLKLSVDERGLRMETSLDASDPDAQRVIPKMKRGDLREMSFAFTVNREEWDESGEIPHRRILEFKSLVDVAVVTTPAYGDTEIGLRSLNAFREASGGEKDTCEAIKRRMRMELALDEA